jgi:hypothetical protein
VKNKKNIKINMGLEDIITDIGLFIVFSGPLVVMIDIINRAFFYFFKIKIIKMGFGDLATFIVCLMFLGLVMHKILLIEENTKELTKLHTELISILREECKLRNPKGPSGHSSIRISNEGISGGLDNFFRPSK